MQFGQVANLNHFFKTHGVDIHDTEGRLAERDLLHMSSGAGNVRRYYPELGNFERYRTPLTAAGVAVVVALFAILLSRL